MKSANSKYSLNQYASNVKLLGTFKDGYEPSGQAGPAIRVKWGESRVISMASEGVQSAIAILPVKSLAEDVIKGARWKNGSKKYSAIVTLDINNAFNSAS